MSEIIGKLVVKKALRLVPLADLQVDPSYQRDVKRGHKKIITDFNEVALGVLLVGQREDNSLWIVDGQQRAEALKKMDWTEVRAEVFASNGPEHEAEVFRIVNMGRTKLNVCENFRAMLTAGNELAWSIKEAVESVGGRLHFGGGRPKASSGMKAKDVSCLGVMLKYTIVHGTDPIKFALSAAYECWPDDRAGVGVRMVGGMCNFWARQEGNTDIERLYPRLKSVTPQKILYAAAQASLSGNTDFAVADQIEKVYRKRKPKV